MILSSVYTIYASIQDFILTSSGLYNIHFNTRLHLTSSIYTWYASIQDYMIIFSVFNIYASIEYYNILTS